MSRRKEEDVGSERSHHMRVRIQSRRDVPQAQQARHGGRHVQFCPRGLHSVPWSGAPELVGLSVEDSHSASTTSRLSHLRTSQHPVH